MTQPLDTELKGSPDAILSAIDFLRSCIDAHQTVIDERETYHRYVQSWKGTAGDAYLNYRNVLTDAHHSTIELLNSFVTEFESCAQQLTWRQEDMEQVRKDAADAGLDVIGMKVMPPTMRRPLHPGLPPDPTVAIDHPGAYKAAQEGCEEMSTIYAYWQRQVDEQERLKKRTAEVEERWQMWIDSNLGFVLEQYAARTKATDLVDYLPVAYDLKRFQSSLVEWVFENEIKAYEETIGRRLRDLNDLPADVAASKYTADMLRRIGKGLDLVEFGVDFATNRSTSSAIVNTIGSLAAGGLGTVATIYGGPGVGFMVTTAAGEIGSKAGDAVPREWRDAVDEAIGDIFQSHDEPNR